MKAGNDSRVYAEVSSFTPTPLLCFYQRGEGTFIVRDRSIYKHKSDAGYQRWQICVAGSSDKNAWVNGGEGTFGRWSVQRRLLVFFIDVSPIIIWKIPKTKCWATSFKAVLTPDRLRIFDNVASRVRDGSSPCSTGSIQRTRITIQQECSVIFEACASRRVRPGRRNGSPLHWPLLTHSFTFHTTIQTSVSHTLPAARRT